MKPNITMIGMPSSGKSTIGVLLAKRLGFSCVDVDIVIQEKECRLLKEIIAQEGMDGFLKVEERINAELDVALSVIAPGGSVIYGEKAMEQRQPQQGQPLRQQPRRRPQKLPLWPERQKTRLLQRQKMLRPLI